jgi:hypothetical protein
MIGAIGVIPVRVENSSIHQTLPGWKSSNRPADHQTGEKPGAGTQPSNPSIKLS